MELNRQHINTEVLIKPPDTFEPLKSISYSVVDSHLVWVAPLHIKQLLKVRGAGYIETSKRGLWENVYLSSSTKMKRLMINLTIDW